MEKEFYEHWRIQKQIQLCGLEIDFEDELKELQEIIKTEFFDRQGILIPDNPVLIATGYSLEFISLLYYFSKKQGYIKGKDFVYYPQDIMFKNWVWIWYKREAIKAVQATSSSIKRFFLVELEFNKLISNDLTRYSSGEIEELWESAFEKIKERELEFTLRLQKATKQQRLSR